MARGFLHGLSRRFDWIDRLLSRLSIRAKIFVIPTAVLASLIIMQMMGLNANIMSLGGIAIAVGAMVDSSIVVLENVFRRRDEDAESLDVAAVTGAREVAGAIVASTIIQLHVYLVRGGRQ